MHLDENPININPLHINPLHPYVIESPLSALYPRQRASETPPEDANPSVELKNACRPPAKGSAETPKPEDVPAPLGARKIT